MAISRKTRRYIVGILIIAFCVIAPILIFYARGYRYDFDDKELQKVGMIMLAYDPLSANATVSGETASFDLTALGYDRFTDLPEGNYFTEVYADNYHSWGKNLEVKPEVVTWARYITLFLKDLQPQDLVTSTKISSQNFSPNREWLCAAKTDNEKTEIEIVNLSEEIESTKIPLERLSPRFSRYSVSEITFAPDSTHILLTLEGKDDEVKHIVFSRELTEEEPIITIEDTLPEIDKLRWHPSTSSVVYALQNQDLYRLSLNEMSTKKIASGVRGFDPNSSGLYFLQARNKQIREEPQASLKKTGLDGSNPEVINEDIELGDSYKIVTSAEGRLAILTNTGHLYVVSKKKTERIAVNVNEMDWSVDNDEEDSTDELLLYSNPHEIYIYDPLIQNSDAVTRYTENIENAIWYTGNYKYIIFTVGGKLKIIELDERDQRNVVDLWEKAENERIEPDTLYIDNDAEHIFLEINRPEQEKIIDFTIRE